MTEASRTEVTKLRQGVMLPGLLALLLAVPAAAVQAPRPALAVMDAEHVSYADKADLLAIAHAGGRLVTVGAHGIILLSDDEGIHFRQAQHVPVDVTLTAISFANDRDGWAVGNWGVILATRDGGENWVVQRQDPSVDRPLFTVYFQDAKHGWAGGLWSLLLETRDGGAHWTTVHLPKPSGADKTDVNLYDLFPAPSGSLFIAAEQGKLLRSDNHGASWQYFETGYIGSFWTGLALRDGTVLIAGLRGTVYRSGDNGRSWKKSPTGTESSVTGLVQFADGAVAASALDGVSLHSSDDGMSFTASRRPDRVGLTALASPDGRKLVFLSEEGLVPLAAHAASN